MHLISFNISDNTIKKKKKSKKYLLFDHSCKDNKSFNKLDNSYNVARIHVLKKKKEKKKHLIYLDKAYDSILKYLTNVLNQAHNERHSKRFWQFLLNQWLYNNLRQAYVRWLAFDEITKKYKIRKFYKININDKYLIPQTTAHSRELQTNYEKNNLEDHFLISKIIEFKKDKRIKIISIKKNNIIKSNNFPIISDKNFYISKNNKIFFYRLQLPRKLKLKLFLNYKFLNFKLYKKFFYLKKKSILFNRNELFSHDSKKNFINFFKFYIKFSLPSIFLENFHEIKIKTKNMNFPKKPKNIITSYPNYDELFLYYCSNNLKNSNIVILQHGFDNIFKYDNSTNKDYPAKYLSWGKFSPKKLSGFYFTKHFSKLKNFQFKNDKKILFILTGFLERENKIPFGYTSNFESNYRLYHSSIKILTNLNKKLLKQINIKSQEFTKFSILSKSLKEKFPNLKYIGMEKMFADIANDYNLNILLRIGTTLFECVYLNKPFILIFDEKIELENNDKFNYFIKKFRENKICFTSPLDAAKFINKQYFNLEQWWNSNNVQYILKKFSETFCRRFKSFDNEMKKIIK